MSNEQEFKPPPGYILDPEESKQKEIVPPLFTPPKGYKLDPERGELPLPQAAKEVAPYVGRATAELPMILGGAFGGPLGAGLGYGVSAGLRSSNPKLFGKPPEDIADFIGGAGIEGLLQGYLPRGIEKLFPSTSRTINPIFRNAPAVRQKLSEKITEQALKRYQYPESMILESAAENAAANLDVNPQAFFPKNTIGNQLLNLEQQFRMGTDVAASQTYKQIANTALSDISHVRNFKLATGDTHGIEQLALNDLITKGFKESEKTINAKSILDRLGGTKREIYEEAISPAKLESLKNLMGELDKMQSGHEIADRMLRYSKGHLIWAAPTMLGGLATGHPIMSGIGAGMTGISGGIIITNKVLAKLMSNEETARLTLAAMRTPASSSAAQFVGRAFDSVLQSVMNPGGKIAQTARIPIGLVSVPEQ